MKLLFEALYARLVPFAVANVFFFSFLEGDDGTGVVSLLFLCVIEHSLV